MKQMARVNSSSETQGQLVGWQGFSWAKVGRGRKFTVRTARSYGNPCYPTNYPWVSEDGVNEGKITMTTSL